MIEQPNEEDGRFVITGEELFVIAAALKPDDEQAVNAIWSARSRPVCTPPKMHTKQCRSCIFDGRRECIQHGYPEECISPSCDFKIGKFAVIAPIEAQLHNREHDAAIRKDEREKFAKGLLTFVETGEISLPDEENEESNEYVFSGELRAKIESLRNPGQERRNDRGKAAY